MQQIEVVAEPQNKNVTSLITIVNYDQYQSNDTTDGAANDTAEEPQKGHKRGQNKNEKNDNNIIYTQNALEVLSYLNEKTGRNYRVSKHIEARLKDGATSTNVRASSTQRQTTLSLLITHSI